MKRVTLFAVIAALSIAVPAMAGDISPADKKALASYTLTMPKIKAYDAAITALRAAEAKDPSLKADYNAASAEHTNSMNDEFAKMDHHPRVFAFFAKNGLTKQDVILIPLTLMSACMVVQYPSAAPGLADQTSPSQVAFCKTNLTALNALSFMKGGG
ncbi:MAG TPA: hypothetical protein VIJ85_11940 [Rhizomicrobium sp.]